MKWVVVLLLFFLSFQPSLAKAQSQIDILVFSPHPDDETLACGGTILKAIQENKKVKIVFLTNGDAYSEVVSAWLKKTQEELTPQDYIALGEERQKEALAAAKKLGLKEKDIIFLSYPDNGLSALWEERYNNAPKRDSSPYKKTYDLARKEYNKENLLFDIKDILKKYKPRRIYIPHPLDGHPDHQATTQFVFDALEELGNTDNDNYWIGPQEISYYLIHLPISDSGPSVSIWPEQRSSILKAPPIFSQKYPRSENIINFKYQKVEVLKEYHTQLNLREEKIFLKSFVKDNEIFWDVPLDKIAYLKDIEEEWGRIAKIMHGQGYNVNFGIVADVADNLEDMHNPLSRKRRMYSEFPGFITELVSSVIRGMVKGGVIPVVKHFPGLGSTHTDTHISLPMIEKSKKELYQRDLLPFREFITGGNNIWIMVDHAIYPSLDAQPASLSYEIQTQLLRRELGFKGIIITDELLCMQALKEYAIREKIKEPFIGEIVVRAFQAGADIALLYPPSKDRKFTILQVIEAVKQAVKEGRIREEEIDNSVKRILKEKERIFKKPLERFLKEISLEEKIAQKVCVDIYKDDLELLKEYNLGGICPRGVHSVIEEAQKNAKIPMFIVAQHEGGKINEYSLNLNTRSAYLIGKEFKRLVIKAGIKLPSLPNKKISKHVYNVYNEQETSALVSNLNAAMRERIIHSLLDSLDELIELYSEFEKKGYISPNPNSISPLILNFDRGRFELKSYEDLPEEWLRRFSGQEFALYGYQLFKNAFREWTENQKRIEGINDTIFQLGYLKEKIKEIEARKNRNAIRILCIAAHPDDEDEEALAYFKNKFNCESYVLLATRGEGGENKISPSLYEELGALRTEEMERAVSILGVKKVYYLGKKDFGYCVAPGEAFKKWGKEDTLEKLVYFLRLIRPHIIITKHNKFNTSDHGQHQALVILAEEAFDLAGDEAYPEMIKEGLLPWQPLKFYQRDMGTVSLTDEIAINPQELIVSQNKTCRQIAFEALSEHRSQGDWQWLKANNSDKIVYQLIKSKVSSLPEDSFFNGIQVENSPADAAKDKRGISPSGFPGIKIVNSLRIGLFEKNNNILFIALKTLGYDFKKLDEESIKEGDLSQFDTIIIGQEVYTSIPSLTQVNERLLKFVEEGGNLIVFSQYKKGQIIFPYAPYPLQISFNPISDENAPVFILKPEHPLFNFPNKISARDFEGWVQERGLYFPSEYSSKYTELISCFSSRDKQIKGGYLISHYGKGTYIYTSYSWYRQFREFHPGAYKNFSNMIDYPYAKKF